MYQIPRSVEEADYHRFKTIVGAALQRHYQVVGAIRVKAVVAGLIQNNPHLLPSLVNLREFPPPDAEVAAISLVTQALYELHEKFPKLFRKVSV